MRGKKGLLLAVLLAALTIVAACSGGGGDTTNITNNPTTYSISGKVTSGGTGTQGISVALGVSTTVNVTTDANGNYTFTGLANGSYTVTPSKTGLTFNPTSCAQTVNGANITAVNFTATPVNQNADVSGIWKMDLSDGEIRYISLNQTGTNITGQGYCVDSWDGVSITGSMSGSTMSLIATVGTHKAPLTGIINGASITQGTYFGQPGSRRASLTWTGTKQAAAPTGKECIVAALDVYAFSGCSGCSGWWPEGHIYDNTLLVSSASMTGSYLSSALTFTYYPTYNPISPDLYQKWFTNSPGFISTTPTFPLNYTITINFADLTSQIVSRTVTTFEP